MPYNIGEPPKCLTSLEQKEQKEVFLCHYDLFFALKDVSCAKLAFFMGHVLSGISFFRFGILLDKQKSNTVKKLS